MAATMSAMSASVDRTPLPPSFPPYAYETSVIWPDHYHHMPQPSDPPAASQPDHSLASAAVKPNWPALRLPPVPSFETYQPPAGGGRDTTFRVDSTRIEDPAFQPATKTDGQQSTFPVDSTPIDEDVPTSAAPPAQSDACQPERANSQQPASQVGLVQPNGATPAPDAPSVSLEAVQPASDAQAAFDVAQPDEDAPVTDAPAADAPAPSLDPAAPSPGRPAMVPTPSALNIPPRPGRRGDVLTEWEYRQQRRAQLLEDQNQSVSQPDGVRKKNAKFSIPKDRTLATLEGLIKNAKSEPEIKELKMQKRLLRNREAALHSRQKKKTYTDVLEREHYDLRMKNTEYQHRVSALECQVDEQEQQITAWKEQYALFQGHVRRLQRDKDDQTRENLRLAAELAQLRSQLSAHLAAAGVERPAAAATTGGSMPTTSALAGYMDGGLGFGACSQWQAEANYDFMSELCLEPGRLDGRADDPRTDLAVR